MALLSNLRTKLLGLGVIGGIATVASVGATSSSSPESLPALSSKSTQETPKNWDVNIPRGGRQRWLDVDGSGDDGIWDIKVTHIVSNSTNIPGFTPKTNKGALNVRAEDIKDIKQICKGIRKDVESNNSDENLENKKAYICSTGKLR